MVRVAHGFEVDNSTLHAQRVREMLRLVMIASVALVAQAANANETSPRPNVTQASNTVVVERLRMPDNFFTMMYNFTSNHTAPNGTTSRKLLKDEERRLESSYCASTFSDMAGAYVWLGDADTADMTDYDDAYSWYPPTSGGGYNEPFFNFENYPNTFGSHMVRAHARVCCASLSTHVFAVPIRAPFITVCRKCT